jgi:hypothetical protein
LLDLVTYCLYGYFADFVNFTCCVQAWSPHSNVKMPKADMVDLSSSNTEEAIELLSLSPARGYPSLLSNLRSSSNSDLFEDWPEANNMAASVCCIDCRCFEFPCINSQFPMRWPKLLCWCLVCSMIPFTGGFINEP